MAQNTDGAALVIRSLVKAYVRGKPVLNGITLDIASDGITAIIGGAINRALLQEYGQ